MALAVARSLLLVLLLPSIARSADAKRRLEVPDHGALEIALPAAWQASTEPARDGSFPTLRFEPPQGKEFVLLVTAVPFDGPVEPRERKELVHKAAETMRDEIAKMSAEKEVAVREHRAGPNPVFWYGATDEAPGPGEHERLVQGAAVAGKLFVTFTLLHHAKEPPERAVALRAVAEARQVDVPPPPSLTPFVLALPGKPWALLVDLPGFEMEGIRSKPDGSGVMAKGSNSASGVIVSMFVEKVPGEPDAKSCRTAAFEGALASPFEKADVKRAEREGMAMGEYLIPRVEKLEIRQKHVNAYLAKEDACVDVHLSKVRFEAKDQALFEAVLRTVRFGAR